VRLKAHLLAGFAAMVLTGSPVAAGASDSLSPAKPSNTVGGVAVPALQKPDPLVDRTTEFVRQRLPESPYSAQYPRFRDPVCVKVQGLPDEFDAFIAKRVIEVATEVKAPVANAETCTPNVHVIFTTAPQALVNDIAKRRDILIGYIYLPQLRRLSKFTRPIQSWYVTRTVGANGYSLVDFWDPMRRYKEVPGGHPGSRLGNDMSAEIVHTLIIGDATKVADAKAGAIADYVAVLALARWQALDRCNGLPTILNLMADGCGGEDAADAITPGDIALLTSLYSLNPREAGPQQRATIASAIRKADKTP
jgi:hypothetical protein